jgi:hypothetical protein
VIQAAADQPQVLPAPDWVHYLPIASTLLCLAFLAVLLSRAMRRQWPPHLVWWSVGAFFYGLGTAIESAITLHGNSPLLNRLWYWAGAILGGYPLATGSLYLLAPRKLAHGLTAASLLFVAAASVLVLIAPVVPEAASAVRPSGSYIAQDWQWVRLLSPFINGYAAIFLIGGAAWSSVRFAFPERDFRTGLASPRNLPRALGTALIAVGALLPGIGGGMAKQGLTEALYVGEFVGIILIWVGYEICIHAPGVHRSQSAPVPSCSPLPASSITSPHASEPPASDPTN